MCTEAFQKNSQVMSASVARTLIFRFDDRGWAIIQPVVIVRRAANIIKQLGNVEVSFGIFFGA